VFKSLQRFRDGEPFAPWFFRILRNACLIRDIPTTIVQGRYDVICPPVTAFELKDALPKAVMRLVPLAGHSAFEPDIIHELVTATDRFVRR